jgi:hypothetical protein
MPTSTGTTRGISDAVGEQPQVTGRQLRTPGMLRTAGLLESAIHRIMDNTGGVAGDYTMRQATASPALNGTSMSPPNANASGMATSLFSSVMRPALQGKP